MRLWSNILQELQDELDIAVFSACCLDLLSDYKRSDACVECCGLAQMNVAFHLHAHAVFMEELDDISMPICCCNVDRSCTLRICTICVDAAAVEKAYHLERALSKWVRGWVSGSDANRSKHGE